MGAPLTATRPAAIHVSASRREASPARAITFATRSALPPALAGEGRAGGTRLRGMAELIDNGAPDSRRGSLMSFMDEAVGEARAAGAALGSERLVDCDLYVTLEPCAMCAAAISFARIRRLYYGAADEKGGAVENGVRFYAAPTCHHRPEVYGGIGEADAAKLLKDFFQARR